MSKQRGMVLGAFIGDSLALSAHWIYGQEEIRDKFDTLSSYQNLETKYHPTKQKGDLTHYGDILLRTFEFLSNNTMSLDLFYKDFMSYMQTYTGYKDHATKATLEHLKNGINSGSESSELGGYTKCLTIPFIENNMETGLQLTEDLVKATHNSPLLVERSRFLTKVLYKVIKGDIPTKVILKLEEEFNPCIKKDITYARSLLELDTASAIKQIGQSCDSDYAFPAVIYLIFKYQDNMILGLEENVYAGGDSAARGMIVGAILGAYHGEKSMPIGLIAGLNNFKKIEELMA